MSDAELIEAAKEAVEEPSIEIDKEEASIEEEYVEEEVEEVEEEVVDEEDIDDVLPKDHTERSRLGRKVAALLAKTDKLEEIAAKQNEIFERVVKPQDHDYTMDEPLTRADLAAMENKKNQATQVYEKDFKMTFHELSEGLSEEDKEGVGGLLLANYNLKRSNNGAMDGAKAFHLAYNEYFGKKSPLQKKKAPGVITSQKVAKREKPLAKLDVHTEKLLNYIKRKDGAEKASRLHKAI